MDYDPEPLAMEKALPPCCLTTDMRQKRQSLYVRIVHSAMTVQKARLPSSPPFTAPSMLAGASVADPAHHQAGVMLSPALSGISASG